MGSGFGILRSVLHSGQVSLYGTQGPLALGFKACRPVDVLRGRVAIAYELLVGCRLGDNLVWALFSKQSW